MKKRRIAFVGILLESNRFAPETKCEDFDNYLLARGEAVGRFIAELGVGDVFDGCFEWESVPILLAAAESGGPLQHADYIEFRSEIERMLEAAGPVDGVFIYGHGAGLTTELDDLDGDYFAAVRSVVGPKVPIVAELDLHANLSDAMVNAADALVGYRTNPHVDQPARARDCARILSKLMNGAETAVAYERLPLVTAQIAQLTARGTPYGELLALADEAMAHPGVADITLLSGFSFSDSVWNGFAVCVTTWGDENLALDLCNELSAAVWRMRERFVPNPLSIGCAVETECAAVAGGRSSPRIYADIADNPGGGGGANTVHLLRAFTEAGLDNVMAGVFCDPLLVCNAAQAGAGSVIAAVFNKGAAVRSISGSWSIEARVERIVDGSFRSKLGIQPGQDVRLGQCALLSLRGGAVRALVSSLRQQVLSPEYFEIAGLDVATANAVIVKSRGHFRAGFSSIADDADIYEVDGPGLTTADIASMEWKSLPRPVYPIDEDARWTPRPIVKRGRSGSKSF